jgi:YD repeat-containing protein
MVSNISYEGGGSNVFSHTAHGRLASLSDLNGRVWSFQYSPLGRVESVSDPEGRTTHFAYNANGWLTEIAYPNAATQWVSYDATGNPTNRRYSGGLTLSYAYDAAGRFVGGANLALELDAEGGVTGTVMNGRAYRAFYHPDGALKMVRYNDGAFSVVYQYDPTNGMLVSVADSLFAGEVTFDYDADRRLIGLSRRNGVNAGYTLDSEGRILHVEDGGVLDLQYGYNAAGQTTQLVAVAPILTGTALPASSLATGAYDRASAITSGVWCADEVGRVTNGPFGAVVWDDASRLVQTADAVLTYDESGKVISRESALEGHKRYDYHFAVAGHPLVAVETVADGSLDYFVWSPEGELLYMIKTNPRHAPITSTSMPPVRRSPSPTAAAGWSMPMRIPRRDEWWRSSCGERQPFTFMGRYGCDRKEPAIFTRRARDTTTRGADASFRAILSGRA